MELIEESLSPEQYEKKSDPVIDGGGDIK